VIFFNKIEAFGNPYHGLVSNNRLQKFIFNRSYHGLTNGDTQLIAISNLPPISRTLEQQKHDQKCGFEWRNYAIVADNHLGGTHLGNDWLLYIDPNRVVWYLKLGYQVTSNQCTMNCTLQSVFGRFNTSYPKISKQLIQDKTSLLLSGILNPLNRFTFERNPDGSEVLIHVYARFDGENVIDFPEAMSLYEIWQLKINGAGKLTQDEDIGEGITATLTKYKSFEEIQGYHKEKVPRIEKNFRVGRVNVKTEYDPGPTEPPECQPNIGRSTFDLKLISENENFIPFELDRNKYVQSNSYGSIETKTSIVRILYDPKGEPHVISLQRTVKRLNKVHQAFEGKGSGTQGPIQYYFNGLMCVLNGSPPGWEEEYDCVQSVAAHYKIIHESSILINGKPKQVLALVGETTQNAKTKINQPVQNNVRIKVKINDSVVRNVMRKPHDLQNAILGDPFSGSMVSDHKDGVFAKFHLGLLSNNLLGQFVSRCASSDSHKSVLQKESHGIVGAKIIDNQVKYDSRHFYLHGSCNPITEDLTRYVDGVQCWV